MGAATSTATGCVRYVCDVQGSATTHTSLGTTSPPTSTTISSRNQSCTDPLFPGGDTFRQNRAVPPILPLEVQPNVEHHGSRHPHRHSELHANIQERSQRLDTTPKLNNLLYTCLFLYFT